MQTKMIEWAQRQWMRDSNLTYFYQLSLNQLMKKRFSYFYQTYYAKFFCYRKCAQLIKRQQQKN